MFNNGRHGRLPPFPNNPIDKHIVHDVILIVLIEMLSLLNDYQKISFMLF